MTDTARPHHLVKITAERNDQPDKGRCKAKAHCSCHLAYSGWGNNYRTARLSALRAINLHQGVAGR